MKGKALHFSSYKSLFLIITLVLGSSSVVLSQKKTVKLSPPKNYKSNTKEFAISYSIDITGENINDIAQTYNGGLKTNFVKSDVGRIRLVSLMRTHSVFFSAKAAAAKKAIVVKESGKVRTKMPLTQKQWKTYNSKYDSATCEIFKEDTLRILNYLCAKAVLTCKDGSKIETYFYPSAKNKTLVEMEPLFASIPGLVMQYKYSLEQRTITFTAKSIRIGSIETKSLTIPNKTYALVAFKPNANAGEVNLGDEGDDDDGTEEDEAEMMGTPVAPKDSIPAAPKPPY
jgi:hypothetical protein